jgi:hypothetical protein
MAFRQSCEICAILLSSLSMAEIITDYLVIGAGTAGMAFADALLDGSDVDVVLVDRRHGPGGHWNDAYPFVRLHQPSAFYGVNSRILGDDRMDESGENAGYYQRATAGEICDYFVQVLDGLKATGRAKFFPMSDYVGDGSDDHSLVSRLTGQTTTVKVRRRLVDATFLEASIPKTHQRSFAVEPGVTCIPVNDLAERIEPASGYTVIGSGKTAMDACTWLLDNGVAPAQVRWIRPRDAWLLDRNFQQPGELVSLLIDGISLNIESVAQAEDLDDLFRRLEASGQLLRIDPHVRPTTYRCATVNARELEAVRSIENVVRLGYVRRIESTRIVLDDGEIVTDSAHVHVDCTAEGLRSRPSQPVFASKGITLQSLRTCQPSFNSALMGFIETLDVDDDEKNRLCPPNPYPTTAEDWLRSFVVNARAQSRWDKAPEARPFARAENAGGPRTPIRARRAVEEQCTEAHCVNAVIWREV